jgi:hypothetical protein
VNRYLVTAFALTAIALCSTAVLTSASAVDTPTARPACPQEYGSGAGGWVPVAADIDGADDVLVPGEPTSLLVCRHSSDGSVQARYGSDEARTFAALLNSLDTWPTHYGCQGGSSDTVGLMFAYPEGPRASVLIIEGCGPSVASPRLQADLNDSVRTRLARLAPPK